MSITILKLITDIKRILDIPKEKIFLESLTEIAMNMANLDGFVSVIKELFDLKEDLSYQNTLRHVLGYFTKDDTKTSD
jgi:hypothetical protein